MANVFGLLPAALKDKMNPTDQPNLFMGDDSEIDSDYVQTVLDTHAEYIESRLPERYRQLLRHVDGEIIVKYASSGQTTATLGLSGATNLKLFKNYPAGFLSSNADISLPGSDREVGYRLWSDRNVSYELSSTLYSNSSGTITFSPALTEGDTIIAEYDHTAASSNNLLRLLVLQLAQVEFARDLHYIQAEEFRDVYEPILSDVHRNLGRMYNPPDQGRLGIRQFDQLVLVEETRGRNNTRRTPALGGW